MPWLDIEQETILVSELKAGLEAALHEAGKDFDPLESESIRGWNESNVKANKLAHHAIDHWDVEVPILHTWYRYGQFVPSQEIRPDQISPKPLSQASLPESDELRDRGLPTAEEYKGYFLEQSIGDLMDQEWFDFLYENYEEYAPSAYKQLYLANLGILELLEEFEKDEERAKHAEYYYNQFKSHSVDLRARIESNSRFESETRAFIRDSLHTLQDALLALETQGTSDRHNKNPVPNIRELYHKYIWRWPAFVISQDQAKGIDHEEFAKEGSRRLNNIKGACKDHIYQFQGDLETAGSNPTHEDYQEIHGTQPDSLTALDQALVGHSGK